jgi:hypothetical protein
LLLIKEQRGKAEETSMLGGLDKATKKWPVDEYLTAAELHFHT